MVLLAGKNMSRYMKSNTACEDSEGSPSLSLEINQKSGETDFCTQVDLENEHLIVEGIRKAFPEHQIIGEEGVGTGEVPKLAPGTPTWIVDPIDGTTNFSVALCMTCVSIGFCSDEGKPVMGVIYAPATNEWYMAVKGHGAFCNGRRILPNKLEKKSISKAVVCCEFGYSRKQEEIDAC
jgi:myo-inositol-1(or 4)-monophosphatase